MRKIAIRQIGSSYMIEGLVTPEIDSKALYDELFKQYGVAIASIGWLPPALSAQDLKANPLIEALVVDRKALTWDELRHWLTNWAIRQNWEDPYWAEIRTKKGVSLVLQDSCDSSFEI